MTDANDVPRLIEGLYQKFLPPTMKFFRCIQNGGLFRKDKPVEDRLIEAVWARPFLRQFLFVWLVKLERFSRLHAELARAVGMQHGKIPPGCVWTRCLEDAMLPYAGQNLYELFRDGLLKGPYAMPWDNAEAARHILRRVRASLPKGQVLPEEAEQLLALRGASGS